MVRTKWKSDYVGRDCLTAVAFIVGSVLAGELSAAERDGAQYVGELRQALREGLVPKGDLEAVVRRIEMVGLRHPAEPRLHYACGLILQSRLRHEEATVQFRSAIRVDKSYGPAWQSLIKIRLAEKATDDLCDELVGLAEALARDKLAWGPTERFELAAWLGRVHGFLALDEVEIVPVATLDHNMRIVCRRLPTVLHTDYQAGLRGLAADYDDQLTKVELAIAGDESKATQQADDELQELKERAQDIKRKSETAALTQKQWASWLKEQLSTTEKRLNELRQDYEKLEAADRKLIALNLQTQLDRRRLQVDYSLRGLAADDISRQPAVLRLEQEILRYSDERLSLQQQATQVLVTARAVVLARVTATRRYEQATGDIRKADATLARWHKALDRSTLKVKARATSKGNRKRLVKRLSLPATYFEYDEKLEADRLLTKLGTSLTGK